MSSNPNDVNELRVRAISEDVFQVYSLSIIEGVPTEEDHGTYETLEEAFAVARPEEAPEEAVEVEA